MKKRVGVIGLKGLPAFGGTASVGENIINQLKNEYDFTVYAISSHTNKNIKFNGFSQYVLRKFPIKKFNVLYYYLASAFHALIFGDYDFIHLHQIDGAFILLILRLRYKVIATSHGRPHTIDKWSSTVKKFFYLNEKLFLKYSNFITAVSLNLAEFYKTKTEKKVYYIPNGVNLSLTNLRLSDVKENNFILFAAGRIIAKKGCHILLEALIDLKYQGKVLIVGDINQVPDYKERLLKLASFLDVTFIDLIKDKSLLLTYIKKAKLFVFPSSQEAMSMMLLEVASVKTPIVCSDIPENQAIFNDNAVLFFKTNDVQHLSSQLKFALNNPKTMQLFSERAYKTLEKKYRWKMIANKYKELYERI